MALPEFLRRPSLVTQIVIALLLGTLAGVAWPAAGRSVELLGTAFVEALKAVAPVLVLVLVAAAIAGHRGGGGTHMRPALPLCAIGTVGAGPLAVAPAVPLTSPPVL